MSTPHTPAPWKIHTEKGKIGILTENNIDHLATCYGFRKEQNARLIAAAPDLLSALQALTDCPDYRGIETHEMDAARAAIAKATQQQQQQQQQQH